MYTQLKLYHKTAQTSDLFQVQMQDEGGEADRLDSF